MLSVLSTLNQYIIMLKIDAITSRYIQYLRKKSISQLQHHLFLLAGLKAANKQRLIQNIINQTIKQNRFQSILNATKMEDKQIFQTIFKIEMLEDQQSKDNAKLLKLNQRGLKQIVELQSLIHFNFANRFRNQQLFRTKSSKTTSKIGSNEQDKQGQNKQFALQNKQIQVYQENGYIIEKKGQPRSNNRVYMVNDLQEDNHDSSEAAMKRQQKKAEQNMILQLLGRLGIQSQITFPKQNITKRYNNSEETLKQYLAIEDVASFNKYINRQLSKDLKNIIKRDTYQRNIKRMSQALKIMKILKQSSYSVKSQKQRQAYHKFLKKKQNYSEELVQILQFQQNAFKKIMTIASSQSLEKKIIFLKNIAAAITQAKNNDKKIFTFDLFQKLFSLTAAILQFSSSLLAKKEYHVIVQYFSIIKKAWIQISFQTKTKSFVQLADTLYNLNNYEQIMTKMRELGLIPASSEQDQQKYSIMFKEIIFQAENMFVLISKSIVHIFPSTLSSIIINCAKLSTRDSSYKLIINQSEEGNVNTYKRISNQAKISLLYLISFCIQRYGNLPLNKKIMQNLIQSCINMNYNQTVTAIKLAIKYNIDNKNQIIKNLIFGNLPLKNLDSNQQYQLLQILDQLPRQEFINRYQIQQYIKG